MSTVRVLLPVCLFVAFAYAHYMATRSQTQTMEFAAASGDLKSGKVLSEGDLVPVLIQGPPELFRTFVPYRNRGSDLLFNPINRNLQDGELILLRDVMQPVGLAIELGPDEIGVHVPLDTLQYAEGQLAVGMSIGFLVRFPPDKENPAGKTKILEPFRVVGIGNRVEKPTTQEDAPDPGNAKILTIAVKRGPEGSGELEPAATQLLAAARARALNDATQPQLTELIIPNQQTQIKDRQNQK